MASRTELREGELKMAMTLAKARSSIQAALRSADRSNIIKRSLSSSAGHDDEHETAKWEKITYAGIVSCTALATYILSKGHPHYDEQPAYPYLHIRNKEFPWGPDGLFERKPHH